MNNVIDVVITWVDGNDKKWSALRETFLDEYNSDAFRGGDERYQDNGLLRYLFRGVEKYMPWVNKIFFVTFGHIPTWLKINADKLVIVKHEEFIPKEYLPTFNSNTILLNLHRIKGLSEHFVYFNDDMFVLDKCKPSIFFKRGLPRDMAVMNPIIASNLDPFWDMMINNLMVINYSFDKKRTIRQHPFKWYSPCYGIKGLIRNFSCSIYKFFPGFYEVHIPNAYLKSEYEDFWSKNYDICNSTCLNKFRTENDITEWAIRHWQMAKNRFIPINKSSIGLYTTLKDNSITDWFKSNKHKKLVCINDQCEEDRLSVVKQYLNISLGNKCKYEL